MTGPSSVAAAHALKVARLPWLPRLMGRLIALSYRISGKVRYDDYRFEHILQARFVVTPSVFNPKSTRTGEFLASRIDAKLVRAGDVLDMGTGSGVGAVIAARHARRVVAVDINAAAIRCAGINALLNHCDDRIELRQGDLFEPVAGDRFDLVLFNPPFLHGRPCDDRDRAWRSNDIAERFAAGLGDHLKPGGLALVVLSTFGGGAAFLQAFRRHGLDISILAERRFINERLTLFALASPNPKALA